MPAQSGKLTVSLLSRAFFGMTSAALAMGRAVESLDRLKTADALPPGPERVAALQAAKIEPKSKQ